MSSVAAIDVGEVDIAVLGLPETAPPQRVRTRELLRDRLVAVLSARHRLSGRDTLDLHDLAEESFADFPAGTPGRAQSDLAFAAAGLRREVAFEAMDAGLILGLVRQDLAIALLAPALVPRALTSQRSGSPTDRPASSTSRGATSIRAARPSPSSRRSNRS